jgi:phospholipase C
MHQNGLDFGIYFQNIPTTLFYRNLRKLKYISKFHQYDLKFKKDARNGMLPPLTVIEPRYFDLVGLPANDDHPSHDVANGQMLVKEVYESLRASPQWNETLLVITYDEHGGFFDHVKTPFVNIPSPDGNTGPAPYFFKFDRLGVRVPTIMVSPWIKKGIGKLKILQVYLQFCLFYWILYLLFWDHCPFYLLVFTILMHLLWSYSLDLELHLVG